MASRRRDENTAGQVRSIVRGMRSLQVSPGLPTSSENNQGTPKFTHTEMVWRERAAKEREKVRNAEKSGETRTIQAGLENEATFRGDKQVFQVGLSHRETPAEGYGTLTGVKQPFVKSGHWKDNVLHGFGTHLDSDGSWYEGEWKHGKADGHGRKVFHDGSSYVGEWVNSVENGSGRKAFTDRSTYSGDWVDGKCHGFGKREWKDGTSYEGEWHANWKHGEGQFVGAQRDVWDGEWRFDKFVDGSVSRNFETGRSQEQWKNGKPVNDTQNTVQCPQQ
jgi:hypothetical protein